MTRQQNRKRIQRIRHLQRELREAQAQHDRDEVTLGFQAMIRAALQSPQTRLLAAAEQPEPFGYWPDVSGHGNHLVCSTGT